MPHPTTTLVNRGSLPQLVVRLARAGHSRFRDGGDLLRSSQQVDSAAAPDQGASAADRRWEPIGEPGGKVAAGTHRAGRWTTDAAGLPCRRPLVASASSWPASRWRSWCTWSQGRLRRRRYPSGRLPTSWPDCSRSAFQASCAAAGAETPGGTATRSGAFAKLATVVVTIRSGSPVPIALRKRSRVQTQDGPPGVSCSWPYQVAFVGSRVALRPRSRTACRDGKSWLRRASHLQWPSRGPGPGVRVVRRVGKDNERRTVQTGRSSQVRLRSDGLQRCGDAIGLNLLVEQALSWR